MALNRSNVKMRRLASLFLIVAFNCCSAHAENAVTADFPPLLSSLDVKDPFYFCGETVPLKNQDVRERLEKELLLSLWDRPQVILWLKRSRRYLPHIEKLLQEKDMPDDLKYISIAESALRPHVGSPKGAIGFWQFTPHTGRQYGLMINDWVDERRNIFASTKAAIEYFRDLHEIFHSFTLAAAAFNMGEEGLKAEILFQGIEDYYRLYLPLETQRYIFRVLSAKLIFSDPEKYGFKLKDEDYYPALAFDKVNVECFQEIPIQLIANAAKTDFKVIKDLNPELRGYSLDAGRHEILIPKGVGKDFHSLFERQMHFFLAKQKGKVYVVQEGDSLSTIAEKFNIPLPALIIQNRLNPNQPIHQDDMLIIPPIDFNPEADQ
jgi:membrane-bound lytic murein transglycosylase D